MTLVITPTTLCICSHLNSIHEDEQACSAEGCRCTRFNPISSKSKRFYQRGQRVGSKRVARLVPGDVVLVGYPGHNEYVRGHDGGIVWEQGPGELTSHPQVRHIEDEVLRPLTRKTGARLAKVTGRRFVAGQQPAGYQRRAPTAHVIETDMGDLPPMYGSNAVLVLA